MVSNHSGHNGIAEQGGFTLVEILFASAIGLVTLSAAMVLMTSQKKTYEVHAQVSHMEQYLRVGMEQMIREIRMAGFGRPTWSVWNAASSTYDITYSVQVTQGAGIDPDTIDIIGCFDPPSGVLVGAANVGATTLTLGTGEAGVFNTTNKSDVFIANGENARVTAIANGDVLVIDTDPSTAGNQGLATAVPVGTEVYVVKRHTYALSGGNLTRNENLGVAALDLAENIDDLQATFVAPSLATVILEARTEREDSKYTHPDDGDGYRRRSQTSTIQVRNL